MRVSEHAVRAPPGTPRAGTGPFGPSSGQRAPAAPRMLFRPAGRGSALSVAHRPHCRTRAQNAKHGCNTGRKKRRHFATGRERHGGRGQREFIRAAPEKNVTRDRAASSRRHTLDTRPERTAEPQHSPLSGLPGFARPAAPRPGRPADGAARMQSGRWARRAATERGSPGTTGPGPARTRVRRGAGRRTRTCARLPHISSTRGENGMVDARAVPHQNRARPSRRSFGQQPALRCSPSPGREGPVEFLR